jgi:hypothetical protein
MLVLITFSSLSKQKQPQNLKALWLLLWLGDRDSVTHKILLNFCATPAQRRRASAIRIPFNPKQVNCQPT